jgi:hypothetical protein
MAVAARSRWLVLLAAAGMALVASALVKDEAGNAVDAGIVPAASPEANTASRSGAHLAAQLPRIERPSFKPPQKDVFWKRAQQSQTQPTRKPKPAAPPQPPPAQVVAVAPEPVPPPPPATPPALPFQYFGSIRLEGGPLVAYLSSADRAYAVREGDLIDQLYKVERVEFSQVTMRYIPLDAEQTLSRKAVR